ncbi:MAG: nucleotidyltransferase domain-containing protein [Spirochaetaceae bacterium]|nr:nucleotidyltransferase domain-containing protein [Spirochaetaceae bacterium]
MDMKKVLKEYFITQYLIKTVILYGSFASGNATAKSDVDIAIGGIEKFSPDILAAFNLKISKLLNKEVDLVDLNCISGTILTQVLTKGTVLKKENTVLYAELIKKMLYFEEDMAPNIRYIMDYRREKFLNA